MGQTTTSVKHHSNDGGYRDHHYNDGNERQHVAQRHLAYSDGSGFAPLRFPRHRAAEASFSPMSASTGSGHAAA
jgi:hypothetical protein